MADSSRAIRPGERTADYIDQVLTRVTAIGAVYLAGVCLLPDLLISYFSLPFYFGGTSLLIVVSVMFELATIADAALRSRNPTN